MSTPSSSPLRWRGLSTLLLVLCCLLLSGISLAQTELWTDGGFESCTANFFSQSTTVNGVAVGDLAIQAADMGFVAFGACSLNIFNVEGNTNPALTFGIGQTITTGLTAGHVLRLSFLLINSDGGTPESFGVSYAFGSAPTSTNIFQITNTPPFKYTQFVAAPIVVPTGATLLTVNFSAFIEGPTGFYLDNISLIDVGPNGSYTPPPAVPLSFTPSIGGGLVAEPELPLIGGLLTNGGFESGAMDGWLLVNNFNDVELTGVMFTTPPTIPCFGAYCVQFMSNPNVTTIFQTVQVQPATTYTLSFQLFHSVVCLDCAPVSPTGGNASFVATAQFGTSGPVNTLLSMSGDQVSAAGFPFTPYSFTFTTPAGSSPVSVTVSFSGMDSTTAFWLLDQIALVSTTTVKGDPQFIGLRGQSYQVHGIDGAVYNIITEENLQVNSRFTFLSEGECPIIDGVPDTNCWSHPGSYMGELSFQQVVDGKLHAALVTAGDAKTGFVSVQMDGKTVKVGEKATFGSFSLEVLSSYHVIVHSEHFIFDLTNSDRFINQALTSTLPLSKLRSHGLLGQTHSSKTYNTPVKYIEGNIDDYTIADGDIFGDDFIFNRFQQ